MGSCLRGNDGWGVGMTDERVGVWVPACAGMTVGAQEWRLRVERVGVGSCLRRNDGWGAGMAVEARG